MLVQNCPVLGEDLGKIFDTYWRLDQIKKLPSKWPNILSTAINITTPQPIYNPLDDTFYNVFIGSSPPQLNSQGRSDDLSGILRLIDSADEYINIAVGEYIPRDVYKQQKPWNVIDDALRKGSKKKKLAMHPLL